VPAWFRGLLVAAALLVAFLGASSRDHTWSATVLVLIPSAVMLIIAARRPARPTVRDPALTRGLVLWSVLIGATLLWEAYAFVRQPDWSLPSHDYPTMSTLLDPVLEHGPLRIVGWLVWLGLGARLVAR
jgi:hypothetical protein